MIDYCIIELKLIFYYIFTIYWGKLFLYDNADINLHYIENTQSKLLYVIIVKNID